MSYDPKCVDLAEAFLMDHPELDGEKHIPLLAQEIQDAIENYLEQSLEDLRKVED
jgi:hypothetical protein